VSPSPRVLILTASYGSGHDAVARALDVAFRAAGARPSVVHHFSELVHPAFDRWSRRLYSAILRRAPALWGAGYWIGDRIRSSSGLVMGMGTLGTRGLRARLEAERPDVVVSTHPTPAGALSDLRRRGLTRVPHALVFSDFTAHSQWIHPIVDLYCVPADAVGRQVCDRGVPSERVLTTGIPVRAEFDEPVDPSEVRRAFGLDPDRPLVLAMAGMLGWTGRLRATTRVLRDLPLPLQAVIVTGRDRRLATELAEMTRGAGRRLRVLGYTSEIRRLMAAADLLVSKAGGVTLAEAITTELPVICFGSLSGHERRNERFVVAAGAALPARSSRDLAAAIRRLLSEDGARAELERAIRALRRPGAARAVVEALLGRLLGAPTGTR